jgi:tetratricopeptide (TPR) repeat protein
MDDLNYKKQQANDLRKEGKYNKALKLYREIINENGDSYDIAGMLHCLRKLKKFDEALILAEEYYPNSSNFEWLKNEIIWTFIFSKLKNSKLDFPIGEIIETAQKIISLDPDKIALKITVLSVLKAANEVGEWQIINNWESKIDPSDLSEDPISIGEGKKGWSKKAIFYNYKIKALINTNKPLEALEILNEIIDVFPREKKFFYRLKALAYIELNELEEARKIYKEICSSFKTDWWLLHEYGKVLRDLGEKKEALEIFCLSASKHTKLELKLKLFNDIFELSEDLQKFEFARNHLVLIKIIREKNNWPISEEMIDKINELNENIGKKIENKTFKNIIALCEKNWKSILKNNKKYEENESIKRKIKENIDGKVSMPPSNRSYCFIVNHDNNSYFCLKKDLPKGIKNGDPVIFDAIPSFDKKKNRKSWKASNIRI